MPDHREHDQQQELLQELLSDLSDRLLAGAREMQQGEATVCIAPVGDGVCGHAEDEHEDVLAGYPACRTCSDALKEPGYVMHPYRPGVKCPTCRGNGSIRKYERAYEHRDPGRDGWSPARDDQGRFTGELEPCPNPDCKDGWVSA